MRNLRDHLSQRAVGVKQSAVRDVFDIAMDPNLVSLAGGNPWLADLPLDELGRIAAEQEQSLRQLVSRLAPEDRGASAPPLTRDVAG